MQMMGVQCDARQDEPHATITTDGNVAGVEADAIAENMVFGRPQNTSSQAPVSVLQQQK